MKYPTIRIDRKEIEYFTKGKGKDVIFIHGLDSSLKVWKKVIERVSKHYRCWSISLPEYGDFKIRNYSKLIEKFIKKMKIEKPYIVGHSLGGLISIDLANRNVIEKMVLVSTPLTRTTPKGLKIFDDFLEDEIKKNEFSKRLSEWAFSKISYAKNMAKTSSLESVLGCFKDVVNLDFPFDSSKLDIDTEFILVYGKHDFLLKVVHGTDLYEEIGAGKIIVLDSNHSIPIKNPKKLSEIIEVFLEEKESKGIVGTIVESILESLEELFNSVADLK